MGRTGSDRRAQLRAILRAQAGDRAAYDLVLRDVQARLYAYVRGLVGDRHLAEDVLQDVFVIIWRNLRWLRDPELFVAWAHRIATREAYRQLRKHRRHAGRGFGEDGEDGVPEPEAPPDPEPADPELIERLPELVQSASPASRPVLLLHYGQEMKLEEVAQVLGLSVGTVKSRLHYGLRALRRKLGADPEEKSE